MPSTHMPKWPVEKEKHIKIEPRIYVLFVFELDDKRKSMKTKHPRLKKYVRGCHLGWMCRRFGHLFTETWQQRTYFTGSTPDL